MGEVRRKIASLMSVTLADYTRLLDADEPRTLEKLERYRRILAHCIGEFDGRAFGGAGDARIVEFPSALSALRCAIAIQKAIGRECGSLPAHERILFRIGLNLGEVVDVEQGNLIGDGVKAAEEVQSLAAPGGIALAAAVYDHVKGHGRFELLRDGKVQGRNDLGPVYQVLEPGIERAHLNLWLELKRRNVVRAGATYTVVVWLLIQVASIVLPAFGAADWIMRALVVMVVVGFPVALILAWLYELTPLGLMRSDEALTRTGGSRLAGRQLDRAVIGLLALTIVILVADSYVLPRLTPGAAPQQTIAVLAFENLSPDASNEYFSDGVADELLNVLARMPEFKVSSRTSSFNFKGKGADVMTIAASLAVDNILEGSVRRDGDQVRVTATLIQNGAVRWTETYDRELQDVLDVQSEIAQSVAAAVLPVLSPESARRIAARPTSSVEAYDYYLRGRDYLHRPAELATLSSAVGLFDRAIALDPRFAEAWAARCEANLGHYEFSAGEREYFDAAEADCRRAWTLDNGLREVYVALGSLYRMSGLYDNAISELESAIALQPSDVEAYLELGNTYADQGRLERAESMFRRAMDVDRGHWNVYRLYGNFLYGTERYEEAIEQYDRLIELTPDSGIGYDNLGNAYWAMGDFDRAAAAFQSSIDILPSRWTYSNLGSMQYYLGNFSEAAENQKRAIELAPKNFEAWGRLAEAYRFIPGREEDALSAYATAIDLIEEDLLVNPGDWVNVALLGQFYTFSGRREQAVAQMQKALELAPNEPTAYYFDALTRWHHGDVEGVYAALERALQLGFSPVFLVTDPDLSPLRGEARFEGLLERYNRG